MGGDTASFKEIGDSQFAPFLDEIIDANDLPLPADQTVQSGELSKWSKYQSGGEPSLNGSNHILQEMTIVRSRIGFDEQAFRDRCQKIQAELCQEFKGNPLLRNFRGLTSSMPSDRGRSIRCTGKGHRGLLQANVSNTSRRL